MSADNQKFIEVKKRTWNFALSRRVAETLLMYDRAAYRTLSIEARGDVVILNGITANTELRDQAITATSSVVGVKEVIDRMIVRRPNKRITALDIPVTVALPTAPLWRQPGPVMAASFFLLAVVGVSLTSLVAGSLGDQNAVYPVEGIVLCGGKPPVGAEIVFYPIDAIDPDAGRPTAVVGPDGRFVLRTFDDVGAPAGRYVVTIHKPGETPSTASNAAGAVPKKYGHPLTSPLKAEIQPGESSIELQPFHLVYRPSAVSKVM